MFNNNQLSLLLNIVETVERSIRSKGDPGKIQNIRAYIHRYNNERHKRANNERDQFIR